jgi:hypothetical protein
MLITNTVTKKILEKIVYETFYTFGNISSSSLLDSLKLLGFYYATNAGISINIEDLKTPNLKQDVINNVNNHVQSVSKDWSEGVISDTERFQSIIDSWNFATESLKNRIIDYYQQFDPVNNLYIMAFSGARGNMSQVRQLVGMRGLMADQEGNIIDLPIQTNFREGLSSIDYIISSYGARKGIVDTALKTADSGYLTRRLIYVAQDLIIREIDCKTTRGILVIGKKKLSSKNLIGRFLISIRFNYSDFESKINKIIDSKFFNELKLHKEILLNVRSPLTCKSIESVCQKCYGWDLAQTKEISLGEAVGIIAAQSIGEPGTQLTMRTFHTGGIFTSEILKQQLAPFSGKLVIPTHIQLKPIRTSHGINAFKLQQETKLTLINWEGKEQYINLPMGSFLYQSISSFIKKGKLISEYSTKSYLSGNKKLKPIYAPFDGEIKYEKLFLRYISKNDKSVVKVTQEEGILWVNSGKNCTLPKESQILLNNILKENKSIALLKIITPYQTFINHINKDICFLHNKKLYKISFCLFVNKYKNIRLKFSPIVQKGQYIDSYTILAFCYFLPCFNEKIYLIRKKISKYITNLFLITESDIWKINSDELPFLKDSLSDNNFIKFGKKINSTSTVGISGFMLKKDGFRLLFQKAYPIFLSRGTIVNYKNGDFVSRKELLASLLNYTQQTEDIVQGLPKIEELIEARIPLNKAQLAYKPGILINSNFKIKNYKITNKTFKIVLTKDFKIKDNLKNPKQNCNIIQSFLSKKVVLYDNTLWEITPISKNCFPNFNKVEKRYYFYYKDKYLFITKNKTKDWKIKSAKSRFLELYDSTLNKLKKWKTIDSIVYISGKDEETTIVKTDKNQFFLLEKFSIIHSYSFSLGKKITKNLGQYFDLAEPITDGFIDPHELLSILFSYHRGNDGIVLGSLYSINKFQLILIHSIHAIYDSQGVTINSKHIELIVRQMTSKVIVETSGDTPLLSGELVKLAFILELLKSFKDINRGYKFPKYEPCLLSVTNASLSKDGFLSSAGFQETKRVLSKAAIEGSRDWLRGLKESIIVGRLIPSGSSFLTYKNYLDNIYYYSKKKFKIKDEKLKN